ncbi:ribosome-associated translation inhibitor RaiA [Luteibacter aegosomatis]|jgi:putative sigma-54 modulation protein|uniref:ribosome hibernation-promoting factor, HPF/YfiA family n=1 Tax=Luteibacter aegosomatis TaxID=2911537 RepID=UPI001198D1DD|nr:ribosome-associated translation inhibitor RaiA [Luteibacter aegosomatis]UPG86570.1 ribosome-associated translation inhibitor RaiA [Luteibacter aegosomatis]
MQIQVSGQHIQITPALRERVEQQIGRFERLFDNITALDVVLSVDKAEHKAGGTLHCSGTRLHAEGHARLEDGALGDRMYAAIDEMVTKLADQLKKHKEKLKDHHNAEVREARAAT